MKKLLHIEDNTENRISYYLLLCFMVMLPFDRFYSTITLVCLLLHTLIHLTKDKLRNISSTTFIFQSVFIVTILAAGYSASFADVMNITGKQVAIFLFPLIFALTLLDLKKYRNRLLECFAMCCTLTVVYLYADAIRDIMYNKLPLRALFSPAFVNHNFSLPIELHATYLSMFLLLSFVFLLQQILTVTIFARRLFFIICSLILLAGLVQLSSKAVFVSLLVILIIAVPWFLLRQQNRLRYLAVTIAASVLVISTVLTVDVFKERLLVDFKNDLFNGHESQQLSWRINRWDAAVGLVKRSPVIGNGSGSEIPLLKELYFERKMYAAYLGSLNVHNQYLSFLINSGIIGLLIYLGTLCWGFWKAIRARDIMLLSFMIVITTVSFSEDILAVNKGIFFYAFFFSFFIITAGKADTLMFKQRQP